jgi:quercetin dioxygenase-like cupin family protein
MSVTEEENGGRKPKRMKMFRKGNGVPLDHAKMPFVGVDEGVMAGFAKLAQVGNPPALGEQVQCLFEMPGLSLAYAWFKSGYVLPRHSHSADCLYYVIAGSLTMGAVTLEKGDGVFIPAGDGYTYEVGPEGVEVLEFRTADTFDLRFANNDEAHWDRMAAANTRGKERWADELPPSQRRPASAG